jgi:predicted TPR repeat methyltransferase
MGEAAIDAYRELLLREPEHVGHLRGIVAMLRRVGRLDEAVEHQRRVHDAEMTALGIPSNLRTESAGFLEAADGIAPAPRVAPRDYVTNLFDRYADSFEDHLVGNLDYRGPEVVAAAVKTTMRNGGTDPAILDAGCGTGLAGPLLRPMARRLDGIDLSPQMIERARAKNVYDRLVVGELVAALGCSADRYDVVVAADVFIYFGDLGPVLKACRNVLCAGGTFVFTTEAGEEPGYRLQDTRRYVHHADDVVRAVEGAGLETVSLDETVLRLNRRAPVRSHVWLTRRCPI